MGWVHSQLGVPAVPRRCWLPLISAALPPRGRNPAEAAHKTLTK